MKAEQILFSQGFGTRHECQGLISLGKFSVGGEIITDPGQEISTENLTFNVNGTDWPYYEKAIVMLNKPAGYECSMRPTRYPSVRSLLPEPLRRRNLQPVGRLDADTTGLLILTDDGALNHYLTHPKNDVAKVYMVGTKHPITPRQVTMLMEGVKLKGEDGGEVSSDYALLIDPNHLLLRINQGKYHQVKRMVAAVSNRLVSLKRVKYGKARLPKTLEEGQWQWIPSASSII